MKKKIWFENIKKVKLKDPIAIIGSPGLGSIGKLVVDNLIQETNAKLTTKLYSTHLPAFYQSKPAYLAHYALPGLGGAKIKAQKADLPKVDFYIKQPSFILVNGYHSNFKGAREIAKKVVEKLIEFGTKKIIIAAGFGSKEKKVCCAATSLDLVKKMKKEYNLDTEYQGPFYGFSGLVFGAAKLKEVEAISLFAGVEAPSGNPEFPAKESAEELLKILKKIIQLPQN
jgi:proteasome assembly chaperone (PAC2) family protein